jgi:hypothetical protein
MEQRQEEAVKTMGAASKYFRDLELFATYLAGKKVNLTKVLDKLFPVSRDMSCGSARATKR